MKSVAVRERMEQDAVGEGVRLLALARRTPAHQDGQEWHHAL